VTRTKLNLLEEKERKTQKQKKENTEQEETVEHREETWKNLCKRSENEVNCHSRWRRAQRDPQKQQNQPNECENTQRQ
jgi:hypothetical protein